MKKKRKSCKKELNFKKRKKPNIKEKTTARLKKANKKVLTDKTEWTCP